MSAFRPDLDAYCRRIGYPGPREPTLRVLREVHRSHATTIPFENLDVLSGRRISIGPADVERKLVHGRRGGYCFEHGTLMMNALSAMGFVVAPLIARIRWQVPEDVLTNLGHMRLIVRIGRDSYVADPGLGSVTLTEPILLRPDEEQATSLDRRRLLRRGAQYLEQVSFGGEWADVCVFSAEPAPQPDFELGNWYYCTHPDSTFVRNLYVARPDFDRRYSLLNREFIVRHVGGRTDRETVSSPGRLHEILAGHFGLEIPADPPLRCAGLSWAS